MVSIDEIYSVLRLDNKDLSKIPDISINFECFDLSSNQFDQMPIFSHIKYLNLRNNSISSISAKIHEMVNLEKLILAFNDITELPKEFCQLKRLKWLSLEGNQIKSLPKGFSRLKNLEYLNLKMNRFTEFPFELTQLPKLKELYLTGNYITRIPVQLIKMNLDKFHTDIYKSGDDLQDIVIKYLIENKSLIPSEQNGVFFSPKECINKPFFLV